MAPSIIEGDAMIYKICRMPDWREAERRGSFSGAGIDRRDGYIHFSTAGQVRDTAALHFAIKILHLPPQVQRT